MSSLIPSKLKHSSLVRSIYEFYLDYYLKDLKAYIFIASSGRSGSHTIAELFSLIESTASFHEPYPKMTLEKLSGSSASEYYSEVFNKLKVIYIKRASMGKQYYVESNHLFSKTFGEFAIERLKDKIKIIHLVRDPFGVAKSVFELNETPGSSDIALRYWLDPDSSDNIITPIKIDGVKRGSWQHNFCLCLWYWYESEARTMALKKHHPDAFCFEISTNKLNDPEELKKLFEEVGTKFPYNSIERVKKMRSNERKSQKITKLPVSEAMELHDRYHSLACTKVDSETRLHFEKYYIKSKPDDTPQESMV